MDLFLLFFSLFPAFPAVRGETELQKDEECKSGIHCKRREQSLPICPAGFFCPGGNNPPVPCPAGTFGSGGAALLSQPCLPCPVGFFNPRRGQQACLPCGSQAVQPAEGQQSCVCLGKGQLFQPSDALCTCLPGFRSSGRDGRVCVRQTFAACRDSTSRNQEGKCLSKRGWRHYCSQKVCSAPGDYRGYDKVLGLCICHSDSLEEVCNSQCRRQLKTILQVTCAGGRAQLVITHSNGSKTAISLEDLRTLLPRPNFSLEDVCASGQGKLSQPAHVVEMSGKGFLGVYNPDPQLLHDLIMLNEASSLHKQSPPLKTAPGQPGHEECRELQEQSLKTPNSTSQTPFFGILNPIACLSSNVTLLFIISREHFPVYDVNNLYNTNPELDWGDFRSLREGLRETSQKFLFFLFQFQTPGTFVLQLSSNRHKRMYIRVMPPGGQCHQQGPFLPSSPRFAVQVGIARKEELLLQPDWAGIIGVITVLLLLLAACLALVVLCQGLGWAPLGTSCPAFRRQQLQHSLDRYSSKTPAVFPVRKCHPSLQHQAGKVGLLGRGEAWEPEGHIDLEAFNTKVFFELLLRQSHSVTTTLGHFKEEVKILYHRVMNEISSLKKLWINALKIPGKGEDGERTESCKTAKQQVLLSGSPQCLENSQTSRIYGLSGISGNPRDVIPQKLIPLLQAVVHMLQENRKNGLSPEISGYSSRRTLKASEASKTEENQEIPVPTTSSASPSQRISLMQQQLQARFLLEKHSWERAQLEMSLLAGEMGSVCSFYQSSKECHEGKRGMQSSLDSLLEELAEQHSQAGRALLQRHMQEIQNSSLSPELAVPKQPQHFLEELPQQLSFCLFGLPSPDWDFSQQQKASWGAEHSANPTAQLLQVLGVKIVKLEALRLKCLYRVLDLYCNLQTGACPEGVTRILRCQKRGEAAAWQVAESREEQQAARAVGFLQEHHQEGDLLRGLSSESEAELRKMQEQFRLELQTRTEEKLKAQETQLIQEIKGEKFGDLVIYSLLSQRHLRQTVTLLQDCHRLKNFALKCQKENTGLEHLVVEDLSMDDDIRDILHLLKDNSEYFLLVLEFIQTARLLQLRETQFQEIVRSLNCTQEKFVNEANITSRVKNFREQKMRRLKELLKNSLEEKKSRNISSSPDPFQSLMEEFTERKSSSGKDFQLDWQKSRLGLGGDQKGEMQENRNFSSHTSQFSQIPGKHPKAEDQLLSFLTKSVKELKQAEHLMASRIILLNPQLSAPPSLRGEEIKGEKSSFLLNLLQEVNDELRNHAVAAGLGQSQRLQKTEITAQARELTAVDAAALSPRELVVFLYGLSILQFLTLHIKAPQITLAVASSLPQSDAAGNPFRNSFFYQNSQKKLFILRDFLGSVGDFLLLLLHCLALITAGELSRDSNPKFLGFFHQALKACFSEMFSLRLQLSAAPQGDKPHGINQVLLKEEPFCREEINLISQLFEVRVRNLTDVETLEKKNLLLRVKSEESLHAKRLGRKKEHFLHPLSSSGRRECLEEESVTPLSPAELEDKVDSLTEELLHIIEDEQQFLSSKGNEDLLSYYLEITSLEKENLVKQIHALEEEIAQGRKLR